ncbi:hypothetical protein LCGC14_2213630, partial [marine sediment metagenome]
MPQVELKYASSLIPKLGGSVDLFIRFNDATNKA